MRIYALCTIILTIKRMYIHRQLIGDNSTLQHFTTGKVFLGLSGGSFDNYLSTRPRP